jgi:hypothetical protein
MSGPWLGPMAVGAPAERAKAEQRFPLSGDPERHRSNGSVFRAARCRPGAHPSSRFPQDRL